MSKDNRLFTFMIIPTATSKAKRISIHHNVIYITSGLMVAFILLTIFAAFRLVQHEALNLEFHSVKSENESLKKQNEAYESSYAKLKGQISYIEDVSKELARQARMENIPEVDEQVGMGGPESVSALDRAADHLERNVREIGDRLKSDLLRLASIPSGLPVNGYITDGLGIRRSPFGGGGEYHTGLDIAVDFGTPVAATADGIVIWASSHGGYGNLVAIYHSNGITTRYGHLSRITVEVGQRIKRGDQIGHAGSTGRSTGPHVHYEIRENDQPVDPLRYVEQARP
ncbi:MAG: M23 family metallopeptidase [Blastocatellia bacterium]|nr:M23 family metallopeptidase [Blastocatellia bacterium]